jgi:hypothetical protein
MIVNSIPVINENPYVSYSGSVEKKLEASKLSHKTQTGWWF